MDVSTRDDFNSEINTSSRYEHRLIGHGKDIQEILKLNEDGDPFISSILISSPFVSLRVVDSCRSPLLTPSLAV